MKHLRNVFSVILLAVLATTSLMPGVGASGRLGPQAITWSASQAIDLSSAAAQYTPAVAADGDGNVYVVWEDYRNGNADIYFSQRSVTTLVWSTPIKLNDDSTAKGQFAPAIAVGGGYIYVAWQDNRNADADIYSTRRLISGSAWETNKRVNQERTDGDPVNQNDQKYPSLCVGGGGLAFAVWQDERSGYKKTYYGQRGTSDSSWSDSEKVTSGEGGNNLEQYRPVITCSGSGSSLLRFVLWEDYRKGSADIFYTQRGTDGAWYPEAGDKANDYSPDDAQMMPAAALDSSSAVWGVWLDDRLGSQQVYGSLRPKDGDFGSESDRISNAGAMNSRDAHPRIVIAPNTQIPYVVWVNYYGNLVYTYWNVTYWVNQAAVSDSNTGTHTWPDIASNAAGALYVVWSDGRSGTPHIYFSTTGQVTVANETSFKAWPGGVKNNGRLYFDLTVHNSEPSSRSMIATVQLPNDFYMVSPTQADATTAQSSSSVIEVSTHALTWTLTLASGARSQLPSWTVYVSSALTLPTILNCTAVIADHVTGSANNKIIQVPIILNAQQVYLPVVAKP